MKTIFSVEMSDFFRKSFGACYLICENQRLITCRLWNEGYVINFSVHRKLMVRVFEQKKWNFYHEN